MAIQTLGLDERIIYTGVREAMLAAGPSPGEAGRWKIQQPDSQTHQIGDWQVVEGPAGRPNNEKPDPRLVSFLQKLEGSYQARPAPIARITKRATPAPGSIP